MITIIAVAGFIAISLALWWLHRHFVIVTVRGTSMFPTFSDGDHLLVRRISLGRVRRDHVVVLANDMIDTAQPPWVIKRVLAVPGDPVPKAAIPSLRSSRDVVVPEGRLVLVGDNPAHSHDSRQSGYFAGDGLLGVAVTRLPYAPSAKSAPSNVVLVETPKAGVQPASIVARSPRPRS
ncbi:S26 family signal peptidase [Nonomuraea sp. H19]|uniref:S26 family signal peptidase n=1 Tax=Nonomuraea sp. H19 TaxID=3452206 RepID=UPI003F89E5EA